jgi:hypothetical protein
VFRPLRRTRGCGRAGVPWRARAPRPACAVLAEFVRRNAGRRRVCGGRYASWCRSRRSHVAICEPGESCWEISPTPSIASRRASAGSGSTPPTEHRTAARLVATCSGGYVYDIESSPMQPVRRAAVLLLPPSQIGGRPAVPVSVRGQGPDAGESAVEVDGVAASQRPQRVVGLVGARSADRRPDTSSSELASVAATAHESNGRRVIELSNRTRLVARAAVQGLGKRLLVDGGDSSLGDQKPRRPEDACQAPVTSSCPLRCTCIGRPVARRGRRSAVDETRMTISTVRMS